MAYRLAETFGLPVWCQAIAKRLLRHEDELFQLVLVEGLSADNNLAERSIRPLVVIRSSQLNPLTPILNSYRRGCTGAMAGSIIQLGKRP